MELSSGRHEAAGDIAVMITHGRNRTDVLSKSLDANDLKASCSCRHFLQPANWANSGWCTIPLLPTLEAPLRTVLYNIQVDVPMCWKLQQIVLAAVSCHHCVYAGSTKANWHQRCDYW